MKYADAFESERGQSIRPADFDAYWSRGLEEMKAQGTAFYWGGGKRMKYADAFESERGQSIRPADFDAYWSRGLEEMKAQGTACELIAAPFCPAGAECFDLWFLGVGNAKIHAKYLRPRGAAQPVPAVVLFHGYHRDSGSWAALMSYVCAGMAVFALDCRGQGGLSQDVGGAQGSTVRGHIIRGVEDPDPDKLLMRAIFLDTAQLARIAMTLPEIDKTRVAARGASLGGGLALACAALTPELNRVCTLMPFLCDYPREWALGSAEASCWEFNYYFRFRDPRHLRETAFFERLGYIDNVNLAARIRAKALMLTGLKDAECPPCTQFAAYNAIQSDKHVEVYPDYGHEVCPDMEDCAMRFLMEMVSE